MIEAGGPNLRHCVQCSKEVDWREDFGLRDVSRDFRHAVKSFCYTHGIGLSRIVSVKYLNNSLIGCSK